MTAACVLLWGLPTIHQYTQRRAVFRVVAIRRPSINQVTSALTAPSVAAGLWSRAAAPRTMQLSLEEQDAAHLVDGVGVRLGRVR